MKRIGIRVLLILIILSGCTTQSISNSGHSPDSRYRPQADNPLYKGELSEYDAIGIDAGKGITEQDMANAASANKERITLRM